MVPIDRQNMVNEPINSKSPIKKLRFNTGKLRMPHDKHYLLSVTHVGRNYTHDHKHTLGM